MSIFPKRTLPGSYVTIHWNFNTATLKDSSIFPFVRIGVQDPAGQLTMLLEDHLLALPETQEACIMHPAEKLKYLNKNVPLLILADYLSGRYKKEKLIDILQHIQSGRHFYFTFQVPPDAPLGKYALISEVHSEGEVRYSKTAPDDFFLVEKVSVKKETAASMKQEAKLCNHSPEAVPVKIMACWKEATGLKTSSRVFELPPLSETNIELTHDLVYLVYNEEREVVPITSSNAPYLLRNQQMLTLHKDSITYLLRKDQDEAFELKGDSKSIWEKSDGHLQKDLLTHQEQEVLKEMCSQGIIHEVYNDQGD